MALIQGKAPGGAVNLCLVCSSEHLRNRLAGLGTQRGYAAYTWTCEAVRACYLPTWLPCEVPPPVHQSTDVYVHLLYSKRHARQEKAMIHKTVQGLYYFSL